MTSPLEGRVAADRPASGHFHVPSDGQKEVGPVLYVPHVVGVGFIAHIAVTELRLRSREGVFHPCPEGVAATRQVPFEFHPKACAEIIVILTVHCLAEHTGSLFAVALLPQAA